jgi:arylamine N-acetyltransferase
MPDFVRQSEETAPRWLAQLLEKNAISTRQKPRDVLAQLAAAFSQLPYENLTKIIRDAQTGDRELARRLPGEVLQEHWSLGTGGTCFSLTWTLLQLVQALGFQAEPILADRRYGADTHCALLIYLDGQKHLLDPGYLLVDPVPLPREGEIMVPTSFNQVALRVAEEGAKIDLTTHDVSKTAHRLTYKTNPVDTGQFLRAWDASFEWDMMSYPVVSRIAEGRQVYLQKNHLLIRGKESAERRELPKEALAAHIVRSFGIAPAIVEAALRILGRRENR